MKIKMKSEIEKLSPPFVNLTASAATKVAKLQTFDGTLLKVSRFIAACKLYTRMRLKKSAVEEQI